MLSDGLKSSAVIWQGYHHEWKYNHRVNRLGSYVRQQLGSEGDPEAIAGHTAASGTGADVAHFSEFVTGVTAAEVGFQTGCSETRVECLRAERTLLRIKVDELELAPELARKANYVVIINGFDLIADSDASKILAFDLEITAPTLHAKGTKMRFDILGSMAFDCRSPDCQLLPFRVEVEDVDKDEATTKPIKPPPTPAEISNQRGGLRREHFVGAANWAKRQMIQATNLNEVRRSVVGEDRTAVKRRLFRIFNKRVFLKTMPWRLSTPYVLRVHYMIIGGDDDALHISSSDYYECSYAWDRENEIRREELGTQNIQVEGKDPSAYSVNTLGFNQISMEVKLDEDLGTMNPMQWGKGMHFLDWSVALRDIKTTNGKVSATLDTFYKCWSEAMNEHITIFTWGSFREAGSAKLGARLSLLQFKNATASEQLKMPGQIYWPGLGRSPKEHPWACFERPIVFEGGDHGDGD